MQWKVNQSSVKGTLIVPSSKSHTIRALLIATLAQGESILEECLLEGDGRSALDAAKGLGAECALSGSTLTVAGTGGKLDHGSEALFLGNSGTGTRLFASAAALGARPRQFDGDHSLRTRPMKPLLKALQDLGASFTIEQNDQDIPFSIQGPVVGGTTRVSGVTSQFLSSLLLSLPLAPKDTIIHVEDLHERPYVEITLWWLDKMGISYRVSDDFATFFIEGGQSYQPIRERIPGDFSSATFGAVVAALTGGPVTLENIDFSDPQGDKEVFSALERMGVTVKRKHHSAVVSCDNQLQGATIDLNTMPDALPALSVLGCHALGETRIVNVKQARIKETDRIAVMSGELSKMGAAIEELEDGLIIKKSSLVGTQVNGHDDHRVVMALALAGLISSGETIIDTAESASVTYPGFVESFSQLGAAITINDK